jgi:nucleoid-associated protein EbfC
MAKGGMGNIMKMAKQAQAQISKLQEELGDREVEATSGGGMVKAVVNGKQELISITLEKEVVDPDDVEMLQDLVVAAVNEAMRTCQEMVQKEMGKVTGGMNIPGLF